MDLFWIFLGALAVIIVWGLKSWITKNDVRLTWPSWIGTVLTSLLFLFTLAWIAASFAEHENQAAGMGLVIIGGVTLVIFALTRKRIIKDNRG